MTAVRARYAALLASATMLAGLSQLQGQVSGPTALTLTPQVVTNRRGAVVTRYTPKSPYAAIFAQIGVTGSQGNTSLGTVVGRPAPQKDQPNPRGPIYAISLRTWTHRSQPLLSVAVATPKPSAAQPVPRGPIYPIALRSIGTRVSNALLAAAPVGVTRPRAAIITRWAKRWPWTAIGSQGPPNLVTTTLAPPSTQFQLVSGDWPNPDGPIYPSSLRTWTQSGRLPLISGVPFRQIDQPNPLGYRYPTSLLTWLQEPSPLLLFVAPAPPNRSFDWPNPRGPEYSVTLRTWTQNPLTLKGRDQFFGLGGPTYDWPNPRGYVYATSLLTWTQDATTRLSGSASVRPLDWPNPRGYAYPTSLLTWTDSLELAILSAAPNRPFDWPNPAPAVPAIDLRTIAQAIPAPLLELLTTTPPIGVNIDLTVVLATDWLQLTVCLNKAVDLDVTTNCTIELKVP